MLEVLKTGLLDLARAVGEGIPLIVGGGFGLFLKQEAMRKVGTRTLFDQLPEPRATNDIDLFVRMDVLVRLDAVKEIQEQIELLGFAPVVGAEYLQWIRQDEEGREVKVDLLCGPVGDHEDKLHTKNPPRVRPKAPKNTLRFHTRRTDEALELDAHAEKMTVEGRCSDGAAEARPIYIPHPFTYLMMKLFAFDDRKEDDQKDVGRHHAMDTYRIVGMMTEPEYEETIALGQKHQTDPRVIRVQQIVRDHFAERTALGMLRLREHNLFREEFQVNDFGAVLSEVFPAK